MGERRSVLIVTNDFPPRQGGIQSMISELAARLPAGELAVYCSNYPGAPDFDAELNYPVRRHRTGLLIPTPAAQRAVLDAATDFGSRVVWFGAAAPLALLAPALRRRGVEHQVASTHGHEVGWAKLPAARQALRRIGNSVDVVTYLTDYTRARLVDALGPHPLLEQLTPGVDCNAFRPQPGVNAVRQRHGLLDRTVIICVSRLVPRKGQDTLIRALASIAAAHPDVALLLVGDGRYRSQLQRLAVSLGVADRVIFTGAVPDGELAEHYAAGDVFAMPCRTRRWGTDVEGLGIVYLEASAAGLPVVAGDSGGAPEAVLDGDTGFVVPGGNVPAVAARISELLADRPRASRMGARGRDWVGQNWQWDQIADRLAGLLRL